MFHLHRRSIGVDRLLEIADHTAPRRWRLAFSWVAGIAAIGTAMLLCFMLYGATVALAVGLTVFVVGYMLLMGRCVSRKCDRRDW